MPTPLPDKKGCTCWIGSERPWTERQDCPIHSSGPAPDPPAEHRGGHECDDPICQAVSRGHKAGWEAAEKHFASLAAQATTGMKCALDGTPLKPGHPTDRDYYCPTCQARLSVAAQATKERDEARRVAADFRETNNRLRKGDVEHAQAAGALSDAWSALERIKEAENEEWGDDYEAEVRAGISELAAALARFPEEQPND